MENDSSKKKAYKDKCNKADDSEIFFQRVITCIELKEYNTAIKYLLKYKEINCSNEDCGICYLYCAFLNSRISKYDEAIKYFSNAISIEYKISEIERVIKILAYLGRSEVKYKIKQYKGSIIDRKQYKKLIKNKYPNLFLIISELENLSSSQTYLNQYVYKIKLFISLSEKRISKYDLIQDYKKKINSSRINEIIDKLQTIGNEKYKIGDYKAAIKAIRRSEKYY